MYRKVKGIKPWVRVGISPFGIWKPGVPRGTTAHINAYEHLAADSWKWLTSGWCDYLSPQLYWRIKGPQSFSLLLEWWRAQGGRPVWPGLATARIKSTEDPGRPASEIVNQLRLSRTVGRNYAGHVHWSSKALMENRGGITTALSKSIYTHPALVPPMPWLSKMRPRAPRARAMTSKGMTLVQWSKVPSTMKYVVQARYGRSWNTYAVMHGSSLSVNLSGSPDAVAVCSVDRYGVASDACVLGRR